MRVPVVPPVKTCGALTSTSTGASSRNSCTIIALQETGAPADAENLADFLLELYQLDYEATAVAGPNTQSSEFPLTNSLLTRRDQVTVLQAGAPQGCSPKDYEVPANAGDCPRIACEP